MTKQTIKRIDDSIIYECEAETFKEAVEEAVKQGVSLSHANLWGANLRGANLEGAEISDSETLEGFITRIHNIGSRRASLTAFQVKDKGIYLRTGCYWGSVKDFVKRVKEQHGDNHHAKDYLTAVKLIKTMAENNDE